MAGHARGRQTRKDILETAARLFSLHGYFHTSTADIMEAVSVSKGAFYHHFKSKENLAERVLDNLRHDYENVVMAPVLNVEPARRFSEFLKRLVDLNLSGQWFNCLLLARLAQEMAHQFGGLSSQVAEVVDWLRQICRDYIADGQTAGVIRPDADAASAAELVIAAHLGAVSCRELKDGVMDLDAIMKQILRLLAVQDN